MSREQRVRDVVDRALAHRVDRLDQVRRALGAGAETAEEVVAVVYGDVEPGLWPAAEATVRAQLAYLAMHPRPLGRTGTPARHGTLARSPSLDALAGEPPTDDALARGSQAWAMRWVRFPRRHQSPHLVRVRPRAGRASRRPRPR